MTLTRLLMGRCLVGKLELRSQPDLDFRQPSHPGLPIGESLRLPDQRAFLVPADRVRPIERERCRPWTQQARTGRQRQYGAAVQRLQRERPPAIAATAAE